AGVLVTGLLELSLDDAPILFITGMNEGNIPSSINSDPFLPNQMRTELGLQDNSKRYARDFVLLAGAVKNRENVSLIVPKAGDQGDPLAPSRLFFACSEKKTVERIQRFYDKSFSL